MTKGIDVPFWFEH